ncbi:MAG: Crp/Fnr family transcriptional regulator [Desulfobacterota bacterium]|nr:Crp/Fnr family transcriptional regulator [Thermodesulfobacteriota bacterium]MDW8001277.1 Crp/Fnr family transcriptional regulator [Deltaproteobacteria bacterium]
MIEENVFDFAILSGLSEKAKEGIIKSADHGSVKKKGKLFLEGQTAQRFYLVLNGKFKLTKTNDDGKSVLIRYAGPGEILGATSLFGEKCYGVSAEAVHDSSVLSWPKGVILEALRVYPQLTLNILKVVIDRFEEVQNRLLELYSEDLKKRIGRALLRLTAYERKRVSAGISIDLPISREELAQYACTTLYSVSRILKDWESKGWIASRRKKIVIIDPDAIDDVTKGSTG